jgi:hypothetical protein
MRSKSKVNALFGLQSVTLNTAWRIVAYGVTTGNGYDRGEPPRVAVDDVREVLK